MAGEITKVAIIGASGYSGENLVRLLLRHPNAELACITSRKYANQALGSIFPKFRGLPGADLLFIEPEIDAIAASGATVAFLALPHGVAAEFAAPLLQNGLRVIDLSADFRLDCPDVYKEFYENDHPDPKLLTQAVYGLPEVHGAEIARANLVASPGCYPTSMLIPLIPLVREGLIDPTSIGVFSTSGVSGAGRNASIPLLYVECNESVRAYGVPKHRHLSEVEQELSRAAGSPIVITFTPHLVPVTAGICTTIYVRPQEGATTEQLRATYAKAYDSAYFVRVLPDDALPDTKNVVGTNFIDIAWREDVRTGRWLLFSAEDNLGKGASSQAIQSFNLMTGLAETTSLDLL